MLKQELEKKFCELQNDYNRLYESHKALIHQYDALDAAYLDEVQTVKSYESMATEMFKMILKIPAVKDELMRVIEENIGQTHIIENAVDQAVEYIEDAPYRRAMEA